MIEWTEVKAGFDIAKNLSAMDDIREYMLNYWYPQFANHPVTHDSLKAQADNIVAQYVELNTQPPLGNLGQVEDNNSLLGLMERTFAESIDLWDKGQQNSEDAAVVNYNLRGAWMNAYWTGGGHWMGDGTSDGASPDWVVTTGYGHNPTGPEYGLGHYTWFV